MGHTDADGHGERTLRDGKANVMASTRDVRPASVAVASIAVHSCTPTHTLSSSCHYQILSTAFLAFTRLHARASQTVLMNLTWRYREI